MQPAKDIGYLMQHIASTMSRQNDDLLKDRLGIGYSQFKILMVLQRNPHIQQRQIAEALGQTEASISRQIKLMIQKGLLRTTISQQNKRQHITAPTEKGMRIADEAMQSLNVYHTPMFNRLSEKEQLYLQRILTAMHEYTCQSGKAGACDRPFSM